MRRNASRRSTRPTRPCPTRSSASATTASARTSGGFPRTGSSASVPGPADSGAGPVGVPARPGPRRAPTSAAGFGGGGFEGIDIEDLLGGMFGGRGRGRAAPALRERIRRPSSRSPWRRPIAAGARRSRSTARRARAATRSRSLPASTTAGGSGWPAREGGGSATARPATSTWWCGCCRTRSSACTAGTSTST